MADATYEPKVYKNENGDKQVVASGGQIDIESGGAFKVAGVDKTAAVAAAVEKPVDGLATGYKIARGEIALDGTNPTAIGTGLTTVTGFACALKGTAAPGVGTTIITYDISGGTVNLYAWKPTSNVDPTLIASTGTETVGWLAVGT